MIKHSKRLQALAEQKRLADLQRLASCTTRGLTLYELSSGGNVPLNVYERGLNDALTMLRKTGGDIYKVTIGTVDDCFYFLFGGPLQTWLDKLERLPDAKVGGPYRKHNAAADS